MLSLRIYPQFLYFSLKASGLPSLTLAILISTIGRSCLQCRKLSKYNKSVMPAKRRPGREYEPYSFFRSIHFWFLPVLSFQRRLKCIGECIKSIAHHLMCIAHSPADSDHHLAGLEHYLARAAYYLKGTEHYIRRIKHYSEWIEHICSAPLRWLFKGEDASAGEED